MNKLSELLFPNIKNDIFYYENKYPNRNLKEGAIVTRFAPSPTGYIHMGGLYTSFISLLFAKQTNGIFFLRIEDTDDKRKVENGTEKIINDLKEFSIIPDEGPTSGGLYGPYIQSERKEIYNTYAKFMIENDMAYPCFLTEKELEDIRFKQENKKERIGYYGKYAISRNLSFEEIKEKIDNNEPYVIRLKSNGSFDKKITIKDAIKGEITFPENDMDIVLLKQDGIPTYHFAHIIDDHLMHTTHIIRGDEWLSSVPIHVQMFKMLGFNIPKYAHISPLTKKEGTTIRKLSKRKDKEALISYYEEIGIPSDAIKLYLATLINADFENWYNQNQNKTINDFLFKFNRMSVGGTFFDIEKLQNITKTYFSLLKAKDLYTMTANYLEKHDEKFYKTFTANKDYSISILNIEREVKRPRKDIGALSDIKTLFSFFYDELFYSKNFTNNQFIINKKESVNILKEYINIYDEKDDKDTWFNKIKDLSFKYNYSREVKEYKENPDDYNGHIGDVCQIIRVCMTDQLETPDLYEILKIMGKERVTNRINNLTEKNYIKELK